jgi:hypothetical protein
MFDSRRAIVPVSPKDVVSSVTLRIAITDKLLDPLLSNHHNSRNHTSPQNTKWMDGTVDFGNIELPHELSMAEGILALPGILSTKSEREIVLLHIDRTPFVYQLAKLSPYELMLKIGAVQTNFGPLMFLLFYVPDPLNPQLPFTMVDCHVNPTDINSMQPWYDLANQSHWHYFIVDEDDTVQNFYEFENVYNLKDSLQQVEKMCKGMPGGDFAKVKADFCANYSLNELYDL